MFHKRLLFISKELQLIQRITVNGAVPCTSKTSGTNSSLLLIKKNPQGKKREEKARSSVGRNFEKSHNTNTKFHFRDVTITSEDYKIFLYISENYNQQSHSPHFKNYNQQSLSYISRSQPINPSQGKNHKKGKEKRKEKEKMRGKGKRGKDMNNGESGT